MITQQAQIKINLPLALKDFLESRASRFDMPLAGYVKHLIIKDVSDLDFPVFKMSERSEKKLEVALKEKDKAVNATEFFKHLNDS